MLRIVFTLFLVLNFFSQSEAQINYKQRANYLYRYMDLVIWPPSAFEGADFVLGVYGDKNGGQIAKVMQQSLGIRKLFRRKVTVKIVNSYQEVNKDCQAVFIPKGSKGESDIPKFLQYPILIFSENTGMGIRGSSINFIENEGSEYEINSKQMDRAGLKYSPKLLQNKKGVETVTADKFLKPPIVDYDAIEKQKALIAAQQKATADAKRKAKQLADSLKTLGYDQEELDSITKLYQNQAKVLNLIKDKEEETAKRLKQQKENQKRIEENQALYNAIYIISVILLLIIVFILFLSGRARMKQRNAIAKQNELLAASQKETEQKNILLAASQKETEEKNKLLEESKRITDEKNAQLRQQRELLQDQNNEITKKNNQITDSIRYAQTIQNAVLPSFDESEYLKHFYLMYMPKDIVSGDFYWTTKVDNSIILIVADSTGHGVPGAFMSMVGADLFNEIILGKKIIDPSKILENLHWGLFKRLNQEKEENKDGMDVCVCVIEQNDEPKEKVIFSGAKRPLFYTEAGEFKRVQGDKTYIGGIKQKEVVFTNKEFYLEKTDMLYLTTDGYVDTPNPKKKKFGTGQFIKLIEEIKGLDVKEQGKLLEEHLEIHRQGTPLRDDVTVLAVRVG